MSSRRNDGIRAVVVPRRSGDESNRLSAYRLAATVVSILALLQPGCHEASLRPDTRSGTPETGTHEVPEITSGQVSGEIVYVGSSTIANFLREAEPAYGKVRFLIDTEGESAGGEETIQDEGADLAGIAAQPEPRTFEADLQVRLLGTDTLGVLVHPDNIVTNITLDQLKQLFTGGITNWKALGGRDLEVVPLVVNPRSATRKVFRTLVLGSEDFIDAREVVPDSDMPRIVEAEPGAIGVVSSSFLCSGGFVRVLSIEGQAPLGSNLDYPLVRPLYLV
jgi:ABC-type phosphate transport system substrate-binding protein